MLPAIQVDKTIDAKDMLCPMPVLTLAKAIKELKPGQLIVLYATDQGAKRDIPAWAQKSGNKLLQMQEEQGVMAFYVEKTA